MREALAIGWHESVVYVPGVELERLASHGILAAAADIRSTHTCRAVVDRTPNVYGRVDVVVNNAKSGVNAVPTGLPSSLSSRFLTVGPPELTQLAIANIASATAIVALPAADAYSASTSAIYSVHYSRRRELQCRRIDSAKVRPGIVDNLYLAPWLPSEQCMEAQESQ